MSFTKKCLTVFLTNLVLLGSSYSKINIEEKHWDDFLKSNKNIVQYVHDLSFVDQKAAAWFLLTGGKHGFSSKQATDEEAASLISAMKKVAIAFGNATDKTQGIQEWAKVKSSVEASHVHLNIIYKEIDYLKKLTDKKNTEIIGLKSEVNNLTSQVSFLNTAKAEAEKEAKEKAKQLKKEKAVTEYLEKQAKDEAEIKALEILSADVKKSRDESQERKFNYKIKKYEEKLEDTIDLLDYRAEFIEKMRDYRLEGAESKKQLRVSFYDNGNTTRISEIESSYDEDIERAGSIYAEEMRKVFDDRKKANEDYKSKVEQKRLKVEQKRLKVEQNSFQRSKFYTVIENYKSKVENKRLPIYKVFYRTGS